MLEALVGGPWRALVEIETGPIYSAAYRLHGKIPLETLGPKKLLGRRDRRYVSRV